MATRTITTKLALDGEAEYKAQLQKINGEIRLHKSELEKVQAQYAGQLNSLEALQAKEAALGNQLGAVTRQAAAHREMLEKARAAETAYKNQVEALRGRLEALKNSAGNTAKEEAKLTEELAKAEANLQRASNSVTAYQTSLNRSTRDQRELETELRQTNTHIQEAERSLNHATPSLDEFGNSTRQSSDAVGALAAALTAAGLQRTFREIVQAIDACVDASMSFESAMAGIQKVTKMSDDDLGALGDEIKQLSTEIPAAGTEIAAVVESAARLGIAREDLMSFAEVMVNLGNVSDLSADAAATALARFANIAGTSAADYERLGSTIVALGNNFATSESEITAMASRLASAGTLAGLTEAQIMALSAAMSSVGINAEAGGTAMTQTLTAVEKAVTDGGEKLEQFAGVAGMSAQAFSSAWQNDPIAAIQAFIAGLGQLDEQGESATLILDEMGLSGVRQSNMLKSLAMASETLAGTVETANRAWEENTELAATAAARYDTAEAKLAIMRSAFENVKIAVGDALAPALRDLAETGTDAFSWAAEVIENNPGLISVLAAVTAAIGTLAATVTAVTLKVKVLTPLMHAFNAALAANPAGIVAAAIAALTAAAATFIATAPKASAETQELTDSLEANRKACEESGAAARKEAGEVLAAADALAELSEVENKSAAQKSAMADLVDRLNESVPGLSLAYDEQTDSLNMTAEAILRVAEAEAERRLRESDYENMVSLYQEQAATTRELEDAKQRLADAEARLDEMIQAGTLGYGQASAQASAAVKAARDDVRMLEEALRSQSAAIEEAESTLNGAARAAEAAAETAEAAAASMEELQETSEDLTETVDTLSKAMKEQAESGSLSLKTAMDLIEAGYGAALAIDEETGAVTLNRAAYVELAQAKIDEQIAALEVQRQAKTNAEALYEEAAAAARAGSAYWEMAAAKLYAEKNQDTTAIDAQIAALKRARESLGSYSGAVETAARRSSSASKKIKTQAQRDLEEYKDLKAELDHEQAMDLISEQAYYAKLKELRDRYLMDEENLDSYRKITEQIYKYDKALVDKEAALWEEQTGTLVKELETRVKAVQDEQADMEKALAGYGELFRVQDDAMSLENIQAQIDAINEYEMALTGLKGRGISEGLMGEILGMDVDEATEYAQQLIAMTEEQWVQYNDLWVEKQRRAAEIAENFYRDQLDALSTEYDDKLGEALGELTGTAYTSGVDTAQGLIDGLAAQEPALYAKAQAIADEVSRILAEASASMNSAAGAARDQIAQAMPRSYEFPPDNSGQQAMRSMLAEAINGMQTMAGAAAAGPQTAAGDVYLDSEKVGTILMPRMRAMEKANPEVKDDAW